MRPTFASVSLRTASSRSIGQPYRRFRRIVAPAMPHFGLQLPSFTFPNVPDAELVERIADIAGAAEDAGFDSFWVMDHYHQIPNIGTASDPMLEAYSVISGAGARATRLT